MTEAQLTQRRVILALIGAIAGFALWFLTEELSDLESGGFGLLFLTALTVGYFGPLLAMVGPLSLPMAAIRAAIIGGPAALLFSWASFRFETVERYLETAHPILAFVILVTIPVPFLLSEGRSSDGTRGWRDYPALFQGAWSTLVRYAASWLFVGLFWLVLMLSDAMLQLVGIEVIEFITRIDPVPFALSGLVFGLAIAVVNELSDYVSPNLVLRLLRLLLPLVLVIVSVFIVALPFQGLSNLFGSFSAAATLIAMTLGSATLVTVALDMTDADAVRAPVMRLSAQLLAVLMPAMASLAAYAIWLRVADYGWTPDRIAAALLAFVVLGYAGFYALAVLRRGAWMGRIRHANILQSLVVLALAALWLTPVLNPERISVNSQVARFASGQAEVSDLDLWAFLNDWGRAGKDGIERLREVAPEGTATLLSTRIKRAQDSGSKWQFARDDRKDNSLPKAVELVPVAGGKRALSEADLKNVSSYRLTRIVKGCERKTPKGHAGCILLRADLLPGSEGEEGILFFMTGARNLDHEVILGTRGAARVSSVDLTGWAQLSIDLIDQLAEGDFQIAPPRIGAIRVKDIDIFIHP